MMKLFSLPFLFILLVSLPQCKTTSEDNLYQNFRNPPAEARPFVRWWWNGNRVTESELRREINILHEAGIGGVEINPISIPAQADTTGTRALQWLSPEWNNLLAIASAEAGKRGMITDLIVGSGWPFGGEFLKENELIQRVITNSISCKGGDQLNEDRESLLRKALEAQSRVSEGNAHSNEIFFICLVPESVKDISEVIDLSGRIDEDNRFNYLVPEGNYQLVYGILQKGHREVMNGAPGAAGPVMDHYRREVTLEYLNRLKKISEDTGIPLNKLIRALFCDSIELAGSNWSDNFNELFFSTYGYNIDKYYPFVFYEPYRGYPEEQYDEKFADELRRVRYDYNKLMVNVFLDNFTRTFQEFCTENGLLCRYQAYGIPFLMGMMEGNMIPDIPESNNWLYSINMDTDEWIWNQDHGYMIWNLYAASGGHLTGKKIISCEAMTNTAGVFKTSLEEIKRHDDMNFITGINHSVLHGYNYSPAEAGFPGWVKFGAYFSEKNTWWPWFPRWVDYNSRLSYLFQHTNPVKSIAILGPSGDIWSLKGLTRVPFHKEPWYCYRLWEALSQAGSSCDYIDERIIVDGNKEGGLLKYGPMSYQAIFLCGVKSIEPETALALKSFIAEGGKVVFIEGLPQRSLSFNHAIENDRIVKETFREIQTNFPESIIIADAPLSPDRLLDWTKEILDKHNIRKDVFVREPSRNVFQIRQALDKRDIWFFVNSNRVKKEKIEVKFPVKDKIPWEWDPESGSRRLLPIGAASNELIFELQPLQSLLIVFEPAVNAEANPLFKDVVQDTVMIIRGPWIAEFHHANGNIFTRSFNELSEFGTSDDEDLSSFAGTVDYKTTFESDGMGKYLLLDIVNKGVTEVYINGRQAGTCWYGKPHFRIDSLISKGENTLEIRYTSVLSNYVRTLVENPTAVRWTSGYDKIPLGLEGPVLILDSKQ
jgi:hypothetical protein